MAAAAPEREARRFLEGVVRGDRVSAARLISLIENRRCPLDVLNELHQRSGRAQVIGITGAPGSGKSTLVDRLVTHYREQGKTVGVVAVDPTSPFTGGAILGDRIRLNQGSNDPGVFFRSMASRGALGGLAAATADTVKVLDAMGKDLVFIETVGVGQGEVDIVRLADTVVVVLVPGMGDEVQTIKAGIMEIADVFCVNKGDREGTARTIGEIAGMLEVTPRPADAWVPPIVRAVATTGEGVEELAAAVGRHWQHLREKQELQDRRRRRSEAELVEVLKDRLVHYVINENGMRERFQRFVDAIVRYERSPHDVAAEILSDTGASWK